MKPQSYQADTVPRTTSEEAAREARIVQEIVDGSEAALTRLYDQHAPVLFAEATRASGDRWIAAEVVQETFLALWNRAALFDPSRGRLRPWLVTIAHNRAVDHLRRAKRDGRAAAFSSFGDGGVAEASTIDWLATSGEPVAAARPEPGPETQLFREETRASIAAAIAALKPVERAVISLAYDCGLSHSEIAVRLSWPIGTVKTRTRSALRHLRDRLELSDDGVRPRRGEMTGRSTRHIGVRSPTTCSSAAAVTLPSCA